MNRDAALARAMDDAGSWDVLVVGGGATGLGTAVDAASRGYKTLLVEQSDFAKATSSRSTKLAHGGVRYLQQGNVSLVLEALKERGRMLHNAPHLVRRQSFIIPAYARWEVPFYGLGLKTYDALSGRSSFGRSRMMPAHEVREGLPTLDPANLRGGVEYFDGQFDDARYCIALAQTLESLGGVALSYTRVTRLLKMSDMISGAMLEDQETHVSFDVRARVVINATGVFVDDIRQMDEPQTTPVLTVSQGSHFVLPKSFLPGTHALMVPKTDDGRVLFAIPWRGAVVVGTTDEGVPLASMEPRAMEVEISFLNHHVERYFGRKPDTAEVLSVWSGLRPLVRKQGTRKTAALSREHTVLVSPSRLVSVTGGKWTTYRKMAEDAVDIAAKAAGLTQRPCITQDLRLHGWNEPAAAALNAEHGLDVYGSDQRNIDTLTVRKPELGGLVHPRLQLSLAHVVWAAREEMARTVEDVLARRTRALFLDARAAIEAGPAVAACLAQELGRDERWQRSEIEAFSKLAAGYVYSG